MFQRIILFPLFSLLGIGMGQYFIIVNIDKKEYIDPPDSAKLWEICANNTVRMLAYLMATNDGDGAFIAKHFFSKEEFKEIIENIKRELGSDYEVEIHCADKKECERGYVMPKLKYFGRWAGDRVVVLGDYAEPGFTPNFRPEFPLYRDVDPKNGWRNITDEAVREFNWYIEVDELKVGRYYYEISEIEKEINRVFDELRRTCGLDARCRSDLVKLSKELSEIERKYSEEINTRAKTIENARAEIAKIKRDYIEALENILKRAKERLVYYEIIHA